MLHILLRQGRVFKTNCEVAGTIVNILVFVKILLFAYNVSLKSKKRCSSS